MNKNDTLKKIKENLKYLIKFSTELKEFSNFDLTDGTKITSPDSELAVGCEVYAIDDQNNQTPLNDGDYVLTDGRTISVANNVITAISDSSEDPQDETESPEEVDQEKQKMSDGLPDDQPAEAAGADQSDIVARLTDLENKIEEILNIINKLGDTQGDVNEQMMSKIEEFSKSPGDKPIRSAKKESYIQAPMKSVLMDDLKDFMKEHKDKFLKNK
jgi:hypothetical protein